MTQLISNVLMQPKPDATEHLTLVEKLEKRLKKIQKSLKNGVDSDQIIALHSHESGFLTAFNIVKKHSDWISVDERLPTENDGRVSWGVNAYKKYILVNIVSRGIAMTCRFNLTDKCFETADKVTHWMPLPKPPSEVQK